VRYSNMVGQQSTRMQNKMARLLTESGLAYQKTKLRGKRFCSNVERRRLGIVTTACFMFCYGLLNLVDKFRLRVHCRVNRYI
jgi:G:T-mismatch repair DNA endonuclease (very short patch repair protein)